MNQQIVVRRESSGERIGEGIGERERAPDIRRRALSPAKLSVGEGGDGLDKNERPVKSEGRFGERSDWSKSGPLGRAYQLTRFGIG